MKKDLVERFSQILQETTGKGKILSYRFPLEIVDFDRMVNSMFGSVNSAFFFQRPDGNVRFLTIGKIMSNKSEGDNRFDALSQTIENIKPLIIHYFNGVTEVPIPLFVGSMSFLPFHHDRMWRDFTPSDWFIPELIITDNGGSHTASFQIDLSTNPGKVQSVKRLEELISSLNTGFSTEKDADFTTRRLPDRIEKEVWMRKVASAIEAIRRGEVNKVVLSRHITIAGIEEKRIVERILKTATSFADSYKFLYKSGESLFVGFSPEKLASFSGDTVHCNAIAGSIERGRSNEEDERLGNELLNSSKNRDEHQIVVDHITSVMNRYCSSVDISRDPKIKKLSYIQHLYTGAKGTLHPGVSKVDVLRALHPTPAVGGYPLSPALKLIDLLEDYDRGLYTGFLGWFDAEGNGDFCVALRSALLVDNILHAFAGGGIMVDSKPEEEYVETETKLKAITSLLHP